ncbi:MAG: YIP1 family protein [Deltaproteobacteria bacterium]|nr:YIP1 family protein [Deltaproteobacteria bacterium]
MSEPTGAFCAIHPDVGAVATCDHCGTFACPECVTVHAGRQICTTCIAEGRVQLDTNPWAQRDSLGVPVAWWRTVMAVTTSPSTFFRSLDPEKGLGEAAAFASLALLPALFMGFIFQTLAMLAFGDSLQTMIEPFITQANLPPEVLTELEKVFVVSAGSLASGFFSSVGLGVPINLFIVVFFGVLQHVALMMVGGDTKGFEATLKASFYSVGVRFWEIIPLVNLVGTLWLLVVQSLGYSAIHKTDGWKGWVAAWGPGLTCCCCALSIPFSIGFLGALAG